MSFDYSKYYRIRPSNVQQSISDIMTDVVLVPDAGSGNSLVKGQAWLFNPGNRPDRYTIHNDYGIYLGVVPNDDVARAKFGDPETEWDVVQIEQTADHYVIKHVASGMYLRYVGPSVELDTNATTWQIVINDDYPIQTQTS